MNTVAGLVFLVLVFALVFTYGLDVLMLETSIGAAVIAWLFLLVWRNLGGGNPVRNRVNYLRQQIEYANDDIQDMNEQKVPGRRAETRYLQGKIKEYQREIDELGG